MQTSSIALIIAAEIAAVLAIFSLILVFRNRHLSSTLKKLQGRMEQLVTDFKQRMNSAKSDENTPEASLIELINTQIQITRKHHTKLDSGRDIVLDLAPDTDLPQRAAALRYAMLLAEKEALAKNGTSPDWTMLTNKYEQIFSYYEDYTESGDADPEEVEALALELENAKKRVANLEKFKKLYFELEEKWSTSKEEAQTHYENLSEMASKLENDDFNVALDGYHAVYNDVSRIIENGVDAHINDVHTKDMKSTGELQHLKAVAADQHRIINELQKQLKEATSAEEKNNIVEGLQGELEKQARFIQESETCIQLMEDELSTAHKEVELLKSRLKTLPSLKAQLKETIGQRDEYELKIYKLSAENRKLVKRVKESKTNQSIESNQTMKLRKQLAAMEAKYNDLEEKFLDLKIQQ